jgi:hypothetical protein
MEELRLLDRPCGVRRSFRRRDGLFDISIECGRRVGLPLLAARHAVHASAGPQQGAGTPKIINFESDSRAERLFVWMRARTEAIVCRNLFGSGVFAGKGRTDRIKVHLAQPRLRWKVPPRTRG